MEMTRAERIKSEIETKQRLEDLIESKLQFLKKANDFLVYTLEYGNVDLIKKVRRDIQETENDLKQYENELVHCEFWLECNGVELTDI